MTDYGNRDFPVSDDAGESGKLEIHHEKSHGN